ncbi:RDD family protein [Salinibius halmophilus]|uniref:RDD family protein n=1 Tax=Salinibius halmophilus TaxID=1853216 RepID=UPI001314D4F8|nr:RDD family protein [Salinibius halmophilus]
MKSSKALYLPDAAGFWRRFSAFVVDCLIVALLGLLIGMALHDWLASIGGYARLVGFVVAVAYFGVLDSNLLKGQTLGKWMFGISVRSASGAYVALPVALLRAAIVATPWMLNGAPIPTAVLFSVVGMLVSALIFGLAVGSVYWFVANRRTHQMLHDLALRTYVVRNKANPFKPAPVNNKHWLAVAAIFVVSMLVPVFTGSLAKTEMFSELLRVQKLVSDIPDVSMASVSFGTTDDFAQQASFNTVSVSAVVTKKQFMTEGYARDVAQYVISNSSEAASRDKIYSMVSYGYDMGIASSWQRTGIWLNIAR